MHASQQRKLRGGGEEQKIFPSETFWTFRDLMMLIITAIITTNLPWMKWNEPHPRLRIHNPYGQWMDGWRKKKARGVTEVSQLSNTPACPSVLLSTNDQRPWISASSPGTTAVATLSFSAGFEGDVASVELAAVLPSRAATRGWGHTALLCQQGG